MLLRHHIRHTVRMRAHRELTWTHGHAHARMRQPRHVRMRHATCSLPAPFLFFCLLNCCQPLTNVRMGGYCASTSPRRPRYPAYSVPGCACCQCAVHVCVVGSVSAFVSVSVSVRVSVFVLRLCLSLCVCVCVCLMYEGAKHLQARAVTGQYMNAIMKCMMCMGVVLLPKARTHSVMAVHKHDVLKNWTVQQPPAAQSSVSVRSARGPAEKDAFVAVMKSCIACTSAKPRVSPACTM